MAGTPVPATIHKQKMSNIQKNQQALSVIELYKSIENFQAELNKQPAKIDIKSQKLGGKDVGYLPIGLIEKYLDEMFAGLWSIENISYQVVINSIAVSLDLKVFNPVSQVWITRAGVGAVKIQLNKDAKSLDVEQIKADAIQKGLPAAKAFAVKNAAQSLGELFGRNINRDVDTEYFYYSDQSENKDELVNEALGLLSSSTLDEGQKKATKAKIESANFRSINLIIKFLKSKQ